MTCAAGVLVRRTAIIGPLVGACAVLASCGGSTHSKGTSSGVSGRGAASSTGAVRSSARGSESASKRQAVAFARAVNLTSADLPGFNVSSKPKHVSAADRQLEHQLLHCVRGASLRSPLVEVGSREYERGGGVVHQSVESEVTVARSGTEAISELKAVRGPRTKACMSRFLHRLFEGDAYRGTKIGPISISSGTPPAAGTSGSFAWRIRVTITARGVRIPLYLDVLAFLYNRAEVSLDTVAVPEPFPARGEEELFTLLLDRARSHTV